MEKDNYQHQLSIYKDWSGNTIQYSPEHFGGMILYQQAKGAMILYEYGTLLVLLSTLILVISHEHDPNLAKIHSK